MKKLFGVFVLGLLMFSMGLSFVSASNHDQASGWVGTFQSGVNDGYRAVEPVLKFVIGETDSSAEFFLAKVLFLMIIFAILWVALEKISFFSNNTWVLVVVSVAVSILSVRWFGNADMVKTIILPYSALGVAISAGLPFVLAFIIIENNFHKTMRKIAWIFFMVVFIGLWIMRTGKSSAAGGAIGAFAYIYLVTAVLALGVLFFDGTIQKLMSKANIERIQSSHTNKMAGDLRDEMRKLTQRYKDEQDDYESISKPSKKGHEGWRQDMDEIKKSIATLKSE